MEGGENVGEIALKGRMIAAKGTNLYLQRNYGASKFDVVATTPTTMDPSFIHVSPNGSQIALGVGYGKPLAVIETSTLSITNPPMLWTGTTGIPGVTLFPEVQYYDADWVNEQFLVVNIGYSFGYPPEYSSDVRIVNVFTFDPATHEGFLLIENVPGASGAVHVDQFGNLYTGVGYGPYHTGEIKVWGKRMGPLRHYPHVLFRQR